MGIVDPKRQATKEDLFALNKKIDQEMRQPEAKIDGYFKKIKSDKATAQFNATFRNLCWMFSVIVIEVVVIF